MATVAPEVPAFARDEAFERLYRRYVKDVYHYALALLRNPADAEDVTQTTFLNAYRALRQGEEIRKPQNWLIKIAHNVARSRYSRMARRPQEVPLDDHAERLASPVDDQPDVQSVLQALGELPFNQRAALVMRELEGRTYAEISDTLGVSVPAVETLIFRARRSLRVRASALKSIAALPLPTSLTQVFGGGGAVAGGVGGGFLIKAAVALVAGAVATGAASDRGGRAVAAPQERAVVASHSSSASLVLRPQRAVVAPARRRVVSARRAHAARRVAGSAVQRRSVLRPVSVSASVAPSAPAQHVSQAAAQAAPSAPESHVPVVTETAANVVDTVNQVAAEVTAAAPPVQVPSVPIQAPNLPKLP
ncbi:MAG: RNA polymerase sigma factor [Gaiellaceae bacterium]